MEKGLKIAICDDDRSIAEKFGTMVQSEGTEISIFTDGSELIKSDISFDAAFLDIEMPVTNGFDIAKHLREHQPKCTFSFITTHTELAVDGYDYQPFRCILKTAPEPVIKRKIQETLRESRRKNKIFHISYKGNYSSVYADDILSVEIKGHCMNLMLCKSELLWSRQLNEVEAELESCGLIRCHRSFMASLIHIDKITANEVYMRNGKTIPIGRKYRDHFIDKYNDFVFFN